MRGENSKEAQAARQLITDAAIEAQVVLATAERKRYASTAVIVGPNGETLFHIVSTWWSRFVIMGYGILLLIIIILMGLVYYNKFEIKQLEKTVDDHTQQLQTLPTQEQP